MPNDPDLTPEMIEAARRALLNTEMARTDVVNPVNGARPYTYVEFHGQRVRFQEGDSEINGDAGSSQAAAYATKINDALFDLAKRAAMQALSRPVIAEPIAFLRDVDGSGSLHPCAKGDSGAIPVFASMPAPVGEAVERLTAWLYKREGGVAFEELPLADQEHWRKQGRELAAIAAPVGVVEALEGARKALVAYVRPSKSRVRAPEKTLGDILEIIESGINSLRSGDGR